MHSHDFTVWVRDWEWNGITMYWKHPQSSQKFCSQVYNQRKVWFINFACVMVNKSLEYLIIDFKELSITVDLKLSRQKMAYIFLISDACQYERTFDIDIVGLSDAYKSHVLLCCKHRITSKFCRASYYAQAFPLTCCMYSSQFQQWVCSSSHCPQAHNRLWHPL